MKKGNLTTSTFSKSGWKNLIQGLKERVGRDYNHVQLKNKYNSLRTRHRKFTALIKETGIGYNSQTGQVNATEEVWDTLKKVHSLATRFRQKGCKEYNELCLIFGWTTATGNHQHASTKLPSDSEDEIYDTKPPTLDLKDSEDDVAKLSDNEDERSTKKKKNKFKACSPKKKKVKISYTHVLEDALLSIGEQTKKRNMLLEQKMKESSMKNSIIDENSKVDEDLNIMTDCLMALDQLDVEGKARGKAIQALHDSTFYKNLFLRMSDQMKKDLALSL